MRSKADDADVQVLEFELGTDRYCVDIDYVAEIVDGGTLTAVPNAPSHVQGVMDLRGSTTTIVDPCEILDTDGVQAGEFVTDGGEAESRIVILDEEAVDAGGATGWLVSDVNQVLELDDDAAESEPVSESDPLRGLVKQDDEYVMWVDPDEVVA